jgi:hypothetical protein
MLASPSQTDAAFAGLLSGSFERVVGAALLPPGVTGGDEARWLYADAPFALAGPRHVRGPAVRLREPHGAGVL